MSNSKETSPAPFFLVKKNVQIYASSPPDDLSISFAKQFISANCLTKEEVMIIRGDDAVVVITKREIDLKL